MRSRILIVEDDTNLARLMSLSLGAHGFDVSCVENGREGLKRIYKQRPDLVLLDITMPEMDGWEVCERIREMSDVPIIMLSALAREGDVVRGLRMGADDYVRKPFSLNELTERACAVLRRTRPAEGRRSVLYDDGVLCVDSDSGQVWRQGQVVGLTPTEFRLLITLIERKGNVVRHEDLLATVWGPGYQGDTGCLSLYIRYLREKIEDDPAQPRYIQTRWGVGYWFAEPVLHMPGRPKFQESSKDSQG